MWIFLEGEQKLGRILEVGRSFWAAFAPSEAAILPVTLLTAHHLDQMSLPSCLHRQRCTYTPPCCPGAAVACRRPRLHCHLVSKINRPQKIRRRSHLSFSKPFFIHVTFCLNGTPAKLWLTRGANIHSAEKKSDPVVSHLAIRRLDCWIERNIAAPPLALTGHLTFRSAV